MAPEGAIVAGRWVGRQTSCLVSFLLDRGPFVLLFLTQREPLRGGESLVSVLTKRGINSMIIGQFILDSQIYAQRVPLWIHRCAGI